MRRALRSPFLWAFVVGCALVTSMRPLLRRVPPPPPVIGRVPRFSLVSASGAPFGSADLAGHVYVASFFVTRCSSSCVGLMEGMAKLVNRYRDEGVDAIRLVSITADPDYDTPERLRDAERRYGVDPARWLLLTGPREEIHDLARRGFGRPLDERPPSAGGGFDVMGGDTLFLVDPSGRLRGRYGVDEAGFDEVYWRSRHVLDESAADKGPER
jgi:protein SCO1/2